MGDPEQTHLLGRRAKISFAPLKHQNLAEEISDLLKVEFENISTEPAVDLSLKSPSDTVDVNYAWIEAIHLAKAKAMFGNGNTKTAMAYFHGQTSYYGLTSATKEVFTEGTMQRIGTHTNGFSTRHCDVLLADATQNGRNFLQVTNYYYYCCCRTTFHKCFFCLS